MESHRVKDMVGAEYWGLDFDYPETFWFDVLDALSNCAGVFGETIQSYTFHDLCE